jgi:integrase
MFTLASQAGKIIQKPHIPAIEVRNTRSGFFEEPEFRAVLGSLPDDLRPLIEFCYLTGWRIGEVLSLTWRQVDFPAGTLRLEPGTTKNDDGRTFPFTALPRLAKLLTAQRKRTTLIERTTTQTIPWVFHRSGRPIRDFRTVWKSACETAGLHDRIVHDFRRTAVRNLERAGVSRSVAMKLTGHKTESVYRRYAIVSENDLSEGVKKLALLHATTGAAKRAVIPTPKARRARTATVSPQSGTSTG